MVLVYIRSRRRAFSQEGHPALTCLPSGEVFGNSFGAGGELQRWDIETVTEANGVSYVTLRALINGRYLSARPNGSVQATACEVGEGEKWFLRNDNEGGCVSLMSSYGKYLVNDCRFDCGKLVSADRDQVCDWTKWIIVDDAKAMTSQTPIGKVAIAGVYTACMFIPVIGALGVITVTKRSMVYGGSKNKSFSIIITNKERPMELVKVPITFKTATTVSKKTKAAAGAVKSAPSRALGSFGVKGSSQCHLRLNLEDEEELTSLIRPQ